MNKEIVRPAQVPVPRKSFASATKAGSWVFTAGVLATDFDRGLPPLIRDHRPGLSDATDRPQLEAEYVLDQLETTLIAAGSKMELAARVDLFANSRSAMSSFNLATSNRIPPPWPATNRVGIRELAWWGCSIEVQMLAVAADSELEIERIHVRHSTSEAQSISGVAVGPYLFLESHTAPPGVRPEDKDADSIDGGRTFERQARYILDDIATTLGDFGASMRDVLRATVSIVDVDYIPALDRVWERYFSVDPPARTIVPSSFGLHADEKVEIGVVARRDGSLVPTNIIPKQRNRPSARESAGVATGDFVFLSGLMAADEEGLLSSARVDPNYTGLGERRQIEWMFSVADELLATVGSSLDQIVRIENYLVDLHHLPVLIRAYEVAFGENPPAITVVGVPTLPVPGCSVMMDVWAVG